MYIKEAHALDSSWPMGGKRGNSRMPIVEDPLTLAERNGVASVCMTKMELEGMPALVDDLDDAVSEAYGAWPDRLYLVGKDGNIAFHGGPGPFGFRPAELGAAIRKELGLPVLEPEAETKPAAEIKTEAEAENKPDQ